MLLENKKENVQKYSLKKVDLEFKIKNKIVLNNVTNSKFNKIFLFYFKYI